MSEVNMVDKSVDKKVSISKKKNVLKKLDMESAKAFAQIKERVNKKSYGRKIRDWEILALALKQITSEHIKELQAQTMTERDRLELAHDEYQKAHGKISLDQFIGKLIRREV